MASRRPPRSTGRAARQRGGYRRHDSYFHRAREEGFAARSVYKLEEIQRRHQLLRPGQRVLDLGCAPGAWLQLAARIVGARGRVVGVDLTPVEVALPACVQVLQGDVYEVTQEELLARAGGPFQAVLSDLAPHTTGVRHVDQARSLALTERAAEVARASLAPEGSFVAKVFDSHEVAGLIEALRESFDAVRTLRPQATRSHSKEVYLIATSFRGSRD